MSAELSWDLTGPRPDHPAGDVARPQRDLAADHPAADHPATDHPATDHPATDHPATDHPATDHPATDHPATDHPATDHPATDHPATDHPATDHPATDHPATDHPATDHPATDHPATDHGDVPVAFTGAGELLRLLASLPAATPVRVADTVRVDPDLDLRRTPAETVTAVSRPRGPDGEPSPGIEIGAYVVARGTRPPAGAVPFPAYESAVDAFVRGDTPAALRAQVELLEWMAATLSTSAPDPGRPPGASAWVPDPELREHLGIESRRIRETARRLDVVRERASRSERHRRTRHAGNA